ncbi:MAG TPA: M20/M25/M40 family metallo-hydrolase, partial [Isosphaeraceae bacterium]|nr:M20/M25/M40 family metallo-hydrolase [Isosphaeraceae bacterium]
MDPLIRLLRDLVRIPSVNPMGRDLSGPGILETDLSRFLEGFFQALDVPIQRQRIASGRENLIVRYEAPKPGPTILFDVHQDTIPTDGMTIDPFLAQVDGNRLYGRGACDVKGSMACMLSAFARLVRERPSESASVVLACTVDEEYTHLGSSRLASEPVGADLAIVAEPTRLNVVNTHKGAVRWKIQAHGRACHSSTPSLGVNAIYRMAGVVSALSEYALQLGETPPNPALGPP